MSEKRLLAQRVVPAAIAGLLLVACESADTNNPEVRERSVPSVAVEPDFSKLTQDGASCEGEALRPCWLPVYTEPGIKRPLQPQHLVNRYDETNERAWPYETYKEQAGDRVEIVCQVQATGQSTSDAFGNSSDIWNVVRVPVEQMNPATLERAASSEAVKFGVEKSNEGDVTAVYAYAAALWFEDAKIYGELDQCSQEQNPAGYPSAQ